MVSVFLRVLGIATAIVFVGGLSVAHAMADQPSAGQQVEIEDLADPEADEAADPNILIGRQLYDADGDEVGEITTVLMSQGRLKAVVVNINDVLGLGQRAVIVPVDDLDLDIDRERIITPDLSRHQFENLPEYEP